MRDNPCPYCGGSVEPRRICKVEPGKLGATCCISGLPIEDAEWPPKPEHEGKIMITADEARELTDNWQRAAAHARQVKERVVRDRYFSGLMDWLDQRIRKEAGDGNTHLSIEWFDLMARVASRGEASRDVGLDGMLRNRLVDDLREGNGYKVEWREGHRVRHWERKLWISWGPTGDAPQHDHRIK